MRYARFVTGFTALTLVALIAGCAGPTAYHYAAAPTASVDNLAGTWKGLYWWIGGVYYEDEGTALLEIKDDGSYTVTMSPTRGANNIAIPQKWSGHLVEKGRTVEFHTAHEGWSGSWASLRLSGDGTLYGVTRDPANGATSDIEIQFHRVPTGG
ncbi:MAG TPA: hypothetical protein VID28_20100 [Methylomirabilota bacterium]